LLLPSSGIQHADARALAKAVEGTGSVPLSSWGDTNWHLPEGRPHLQAPSD